MPRDAGALALLTADESHHLTRVLRLGPGEQVSLFDGQGWSADAQVLTASKSATEVELIQDATHSASLSRLEVALAAPKGEFDEIVVRLIELGVHGIRPISTAYTEVKLERRGDDALRERLSRLAVRACKQCGRNTLPVFHLLTPFLELSGNPVLCDPEAEASLSECVQGLSTPMLVIGPEGGFSDQEHEHARSLGWLRGRVNAHIMRASTAAVACAAIAMQAAEANGPQAPDSLA